MPDKHLDAFILKGDMFNSLKSRLGTATHLAGNNELTGFLKYSYRAWAAE